jgi:hypothetical protein
VFGRWRGGPRRMHGRGLGLGDIVRRLPGGSEVPLGRRAVTRRSRPHPIHPAAEGGSPSLATHGLPPTFGSHNVDVERSRPIAQTSRVALRVARDAFADLLRQDAPERQWQALFAEHPYVFSEAFPHLELVAADICPLGRPGRSEPDFTFYKPSPGHDSIYGVIELKRPSTQILRVPRKEVLTLAADAHTAIAQAREYAKSLGRQVAAHESRTVALTSGCYLFIVMGLTSEIATKVTSAALQNQYDEDLFPSNVELLTYDALFDRLAARVPPRVHLLAVAIDAVAATSAIIVNYGTGGEVTRRPRSNPRPLRGIRAAGHADRIARPGACPYCDAVGGAVTLAPWTTSGIGTLRRFFSGSSGDRGYRVLACTNTEPEDAREFCEIYDLPQTRQWFASLRSGHCGRCGSYEVRMTECGSPPAYEFVTWMCPVCGLDEVAHKWGPMSSGA